MMAAKNEGSFQLLVSIENDTSFLNPLELPRIFKNNLPRRCPSITVFDKRGRRYSTCVLDAGDGKVKLCYARWHAFVADNIVVDRGINKLLFTQLSQDEFQVTCFDADGMQTLRDYRGKLVYDKHVFEASDATIHKEYIPYVILKDLNEKSLRRPVKTADIQGPNQHSQTVGIIYERYMKRNNVQRYRAVGFEGSQWTNFCVENNIEEGCTLILTNLRNRKFKIDVFSKKGVILGQAEGTEHRCRVLPHRHRLSKPSFKIKLKDHTLTTHAITIPKPYVQKHELYKMEGVAVLFYGNLKFDGELKIRMDSRRPNDFGHLVIIRDWSKFLAETGLSIGNPIRFEFKKEISDSAGLAVLGVC